MHKLSKAEVMREVKDYIYITLGLISYSLGWAAFLLPYQITTGGTIRPWDMTSRRDSNSLKGLTRVPVRKLLMAK